MKDLIKQLDTAKKITAFNAPEGVNTLTAIEIAQAGYNVLMVLPDDKTVGRHASLLDFFFPRLEVLQLPAWDSVPYDRVSPSTEIINRRISTLTKIAHNPGPNRIILTTVAALLQKIPPRKFFTDSTLTIKAGEKFSTERLKQFLITNCYQRVDTVRESGEFALRGGILDLFPQGQDVPIRLDFFGDELENIRTFDPFTQLSISSVNSLSLVPASEISLDDDAISRFRSNYRINFGKSGDDDPLYSSISQKSTYSGMEHWLPLFHENLETIFDYVPMGLIVIDYQVEEAIRARVDLVHEYFEARSAYLPSKISNKSYVDNTIYRPIPPNLLYVDNDGIDLLLNKRRVVYFSPFSQEANNKDIYDAEGKYGKDFADARKNPNQNVFGVLREYLETHVNEGKRIVIAATNENSCKRIQSVAIEHGIDPIVEVKTLCELNKLEIGVIGITVLGIERGFITENLVFVSEQDILGERSTSPARRSKKARNFIIEASSLTIDELVVHVDHGIGRFVGLRPIDVGGAAHDCLELIYADNTKLYLPVENVELITRYGSENLNVSLDRLGSAGWQARKAKMNERIKEMAAELIKIAASRELRTSDPIEPPKALYDEFAARFPFIETEDQSQAINDILADLLAGRPTERLICGDVGFGKTEVGLRAAFAVAMAGKQVAVIVPTTLLCRQHFNNFCERFTGFPIRIKQISRLISKKQAQDIKDELAAGTIDIVVGTHALLSKKLNIKNLGLLIIDEEQHFGVAHKEQLKKLKSDIHVLTLTATPIPRTLQLALTGIREMSIIATPPIDRLSVRTFVTPFDPVLVREAILREHFRNGQTFYVCPRVRDLEKIASSLREITPEIKFSIVHGRMPATTLEDIIARFYDKEIDLLLTTNIIESGLDLPDANTIIIHRADMFGLSQLYQLRGRVGRSKVRAYAYLTLPPGRKLTKAAEKRLEVMQTLDGLGAGFSLASYDLDIRGAGNLLGDEQSGHIREVGVELYHSMLEEAVSNARGEAVLKENENWTPQVGIGVAIMIPESYISDLSLRMGLYRRLSLIEDSNGVAMFGTELEDRFGSLPEEVENLLAIIILKQLCKKADIARIDAGPKGAVVAFHNDRFDNPEGLVDWLNSHKGTARLRTDQKIVFNRLWENKQDRINGIKNLIKELSAIKKN